MSEPEGTVGIPQAAREEEDKDPLSLKPCTKIFLIKIKCEDQCTCGFEGKRLHTVI